MLIVSVLLYAVVLYFTFKYVKNDILEIAILIGVSIACKLIAKDGSFYPLFAMPMLLALRHNKPYSIVYTIVMVTVVNAMHGFGIWSIGQYVIYAMISLGTYYTRTILNKQNKLVIFGCNFVTMFLFGMLMDVFTFYAGNFLGYANVFQQIIAGLPFDFKYGLNGVIYGGISFAVAYLASVHVKDILKIRDMTLEKV